MKKIANIYETKDYDLFKVLKGNRLVNQNHINHLRKSHEEEAINLPIMVSKNGNGYNIIDGMHRYYVRRELKMPIRFFEIDGCGIEHVQRLNSNTKEWDSKDYLHCYCELNNNNYKKFRTFMEIYQFSFSSCLSVIKNRRRSQGTEQGFRDGRFIYPTGIKAQEITERANRIASLKQFYRGYKRRCFVIAMVVVMKSKDYDHEHMLKQCETYSPELVDCTNWKTNVELLENIYNIGQKKKVIFEFDFNLDKEDA